MVLNDYKSTLLATELKDLLKTLLSGGLVLFPSDTVWAVGCDATDPAAVQRLYDLKNRTTREPFLLLVDSTEMLKRFVRHVHPRIETLLYFHHRPLTIIYENPVNLPKELIAADGTVAIRVVQDEFCRTFIKALGRPVVAAPAFREPGQVPRHFGEIQSDILEGVDWVARHRQKDRNSGELSVIARLGAQEELEFIRD